MKNYIFIEGNLESKKEEILAAISSLAASRDKTKELSLTLKNVKGDYKLALEIARAIHASDVDMIAEAYGTNDAAGTLLVAAGLKGQRKASIDAIFEPFKTSSNTKHSDDRLTVQNEVILRTLGCLEANRRKLKSIALNPDPISAFSAKSLNLIDSVDSFKSKYSKKTESKKTSKGKSSKDNTRTRISSGRR
jgi:hypothetical protein